MKQVPSQKFQSECERAQIVVSNDMPLGALHDFLLAIKGHVVDLMLKAQKEEQAEADKQKANDHSVEE